METLRPYENGLAAAVTTPPSYVVAILWIVHYTVLSLLRVRLSNVVERNGVDDLGNIK